MLCDCNVFSLLLNTATLCECLSISCSQALHRMKWIVQIEVRRNSFTTSEYISSLFVVCVALKTSAYFCAETCSREDHDIVTYLSRFSAY